jgi:PhnB protein
MTKTVKAIPDGFHSITPGFNAVGVDKAVAFFKQAFGAEEQLLMKGPDGKVRHCEMRIGDSVFMFGETTGPTPQPMQVMLYVQDCDAVFKRAVEAGAKVKQPMADQFYGDRAGRLIDPFGNEWFIATHTEDVPQAEMDRRVSEMMAKAPPA